MADIPRDEAFDSTLRLLREGYEFLPRRCRRLRSDAFETRLMLRRAVCVSGREAAALLYEQDRFTRKWAVPMPTLKLLQDRGSAARRLARLEGRPRRRRTIRSDETA